MCVDFELLGFAEVFEYFAFKIWDCDDCVHDIPPLSVKFIFANLCDRAS